MIYQPRRGKTAIFEHQIKVTAHMVPSGDTLVFHYLCLCQTERRGFRVIKVKRWIEPQQYYGRPLFESLYEQMSQNARLN